jgi:GNAT superfamily N-acetyltransferase
LTGSPKENLTTDEGAASPRLSTVAPIPSAGLAPSLTRTSGLRRRVENLFLKIRIVYACDRETFARFGEASGRSLLVVRGDSASPSEKERARRLLSPLFPVATLAARLAEPECTSYVALDERGEPEGYGWVRHATREPIWFDAFEIPRGAALFFNGFVVEGARRRGVYSRLLAAVFGELAARVDCERLFLLVEKSNTPARRHAEKVGLYRASTNWLLKRFGRNVLSLYVGRLGVRAYAVSRNATRARP